jgi:hypothetical protein
MWLNEIDMSLMNKSNFFKYNFKFVYYENCIGRVNIWTRTRFKTVFSDPLIYRGLSTVYPSNKGKWVVHLYIKM